MKILYVGETWLGSSARSLRDALAEQPGVELDDIGEDHYFPKHRTLAARCVNRLLRPLHRLELEREVSTKLATQRPAVLMVYKGNGVAADVVEWARRAGIFSVNVFPDCSPHAYGPALRAAIGAYDLVVSTKPFHPRNWQSVYGYRNRCVFVPHGYDPRVHLWSEPPNPATMDFDLVMAATYRPEYHRLLVELAEHLPTTRVRVGIAGGGWQQRSSAFPTHWRFQGSVSGRAYGEFVRRGKIAVAPVTRDVIIDGRRQPGDEDSTRTYELAASYCFFVHRRTPYAQSVYDDQTEVPMWDDANELANLIVRYLPQDGERAEMAGRAHQRAVPAFSIPTRAREILMCVSEAALRDRGCVEHRE